MSTMTNSHVTNSGVLLITPLIAASSSVLAHSSSGPIASNVPMTANAAATADMDDRLSVVSDSAAWSTDPINNNSCDSDLESNSPSKYTPYSTCSSYSGLAVAVAIAGGGDNSAVNFSLGSLGSAQPSSAYSHSHALGVKYFYFDNRFFKQY